MKKKHLAVLSIITILLYLIFGSHAGQLREEFGSTPVTAKSLLALFFSISAGVCMISAFLHNRKIRFFGEIQLPVEDVFLANAIVFMSISVAELVYGGTYFHSYNLAVFYVIVGISIFVGVILCKVLQNGRAQ